MHRFGHHARLLIPVVLVIVGALSPPAMASAAPPNRVSGRWAGALPCVPISLDPTSGATTCVGSTSWVGALNGQTHYTFVGTIDLATGAGHGDIDETFIGRGEDGRIGTLRFAETVDAEPTGLPGTGAITIDAHVISGTGGFSGARGEVVFVGTINALAGAAGTYAGRLQLASR